MPKKSTLTADQRTQLVLRLLSKEEPATQIARRAGISEQSLYRWMPQGFAQGQERFGFRTISRSAKSKRQRWSGRDQDCMKTPSEDAAWDKCYLIQAVFLPK
ncbi:MAG: helix-turn-helix domain-containing protein [Gammaproteobacteria bacterium]|jgi:hypothetical protein